MTGRRGFLKVIAAAFLASAATMVAGVAPAFAFDAKKADQSVVRVIVWEVKNGRRSGTYGSGTGFVVADEYVVTNDHVTDDSDFRKDGATAERVVIDGSRQNQRAAQLIWASPELDLAVLRVPGLKRPPLTLSSAPYADRPDKGESVWAIGFPGLADRSLQSDEAFLNSTVTQGVVGKVVQGRAGQKDRVRPVIQHNASINKGNSGGPLFDNCGVVVGVNTFGAVSTMEVRRDGQGRDVAAGMPNTGIFYSPHIVNFIEAQRSVPALKPIALKLSAAPCTGPLAAAPAEPAGLPVWIYGVIGLVSLLALTSTVVAFRKGTTREIVRVVESYSAYVRRKDAPPSILNRRKLRSAAPPRPEPGSVPAKPRSGAPSRETSAAPATAAGGSWHLSGLGKQKTFRVDFTAEDLAAAGAGTEGGLVLGRSSSLSDRVVDDPTVSRRHCKFFLADGVLMVEDMGSASGTKVNGRAVGANQAERLDAGDRLSIGGVAFEIARG